MATYTITTSVIDDKLFKAEVLQDPQGWLESAIAGKVHNRWKKLRAEWTEKLIDDADFTDSIPSDKTDFINLVLARDDYKTAAEKEAAKY